ncbi:MAG: short-chain fatty acyl-CoA regulator family protein, partial [Pseudomonadota bacterium]
MLSEALDPPSRAFHTAHHYALMAESEALDALLAESGVAEDEEARRMGRVALANYYAAAEAVIALHAAYRDVTERAALFAQRIDANSGVGLFQDSKQPTERIRDFLHARNNHFPELESAADALWRSADIRAREVFDGVRRAFAQDGVSVAVVPASVLAGDLRRFDLHGRRLMLSEALDPPSRAFHTAHHYALMAESEALDSLLAESGVAEDEEARRMGRVALANYYAAAVLAPYDRFIRVARELRYDIVGLMRRFEMSFEQVAHRLTTLNKPGAKGVPFFLMRVDSAGNVSKRFSAGGFHFGRFGGGCPRWVVHDAFATPDRIRTQLVETADGAAYLTIAMASPRSGVAFDDGRSAGLLAVVVGCPIDQIGEVVYGDDYAVEDEAARARIGAGCRVCQ